MKDVDSKIRPFSLSAILVATLLVTGCSAATTSASTSTNVAPTATPSTSSIQNENITIAGDINTKVVKALVKGCGFSKALSNHNGLALEFFISGTSYSLLVVDPSFGTAGQSKPELVEFTQDVPPNTSPSVAEINKLPLWENLGVNAGAYATLANSITYSSDGRSGTINFDLSRVPADGSPPPAQKNLQVTGQWSC